MEMVAAPTNGVMSSPFHDHDVREWSRINSLTGVLERARLETNQWTANTNNAKHKYGKVVDSRARTDADGALQQKASRQLEVFQSQVPGGHLQVIKTHTVSSSRWTGNSSSTVNNSIENGFDNLELSLNSLDVSSQKSKASISKSASRRPPTRSRSKDFNTSDSPFNPQVTLATNLQRVSRLCHQIHENAVKQAFSRFNQPKQIKNERESENDPVEIVEITSINSSESNEKSNSSTGHGSLSRTKSNSSEDLILRHDFTQKSLEDLEDLEELQNWRRTSKLRRSLQYPKLNKTTNKSLDVPISPGSVKKIKEDLEKGRRLNTALRGNNADIQTLDQILQTLSNSSSNTSVESEETDITSQSSKLKRNSFVTVESIKEVKERLRHTSSSSDICSQHQEQPDKIRHSNKETNEKIMDSSKQSKVRSYVYGMEELLIKNPIAGTGSLDTRKISNNSAANRNDDWYNRRKSYGFEQVENKEKISSFNNKIESSTDSGICRSNEIVVVPTQNMYNHDTAEEISSDAPSEFDDKSKQISNGGGNVKRLRYIFNSPTKTDTKPTLSERRASLQNAPWLNKANLESTKIKIPITSNGTSSWYNENGNEIKRHSIAVDETKYVPANVKDNVYRTSLIFNDKSSYPIIQDGHDDINGRRYKKVEFCKTEVHFAAESGKVNIVETDEKPPPTQNFRRRRRYSGPIDMLETVKTNLPMLHFGETAENKLFSDLKTYDSYSSEIEPENENAETMVTVNANRQNYLSAFEDDRRDLLESENIKGILKNKPIKPKPYLLGDHDHRNFASDDEQLKPTNDKTDEIPIWKSTVRLQNQFYNHNLQSDDDVPVKNITKNSIIKPDLIRDPTIKLVGANISTDNHGSTWTVADRIKLVEESNKQNDGKGYLTKIHFGSGEATVVNNTAKPLNDDLQQAEADISKHYKFLDDELFNYKEEDLINDPIIKRTKPAQEENLFEKPKSSPILNDKKVHNSFHEVKQMTNSSQEYKSDDSLKHKNKFIHSDIVLRQPKKSEMTYFGINVAKNTSDKKVKTRVVSDKPDLLLFNQRTISEPLPIKKNENKIQNQHEPIYQNLIMSPDQRQAKQKQLFNSQILDELTKVADELVQAVNSLDDDSKTKSRNVSKELKNESLDTITESKSWKQNKTTRLSRPCNTKQKTPTAYSNEHKKDTKSVLSKQDTSPKPTSAKTNIRTSTRHSDSSIKSNNKATRRLQRASSREALLQSHGSSSEDLGANVELPVRKPRLIKKTKTTQLTMNNGIEIQKKEEHQPQKVVRKKEDSSKGKSVERITGKLPEIRHKAAVSTIRSTAEHSSRDRTKHRTEESKLTHSSKRQNEKVSRSSPKDVKPKVGSSGLKKETVNHRICTANIKKCGRPEY